MDIVFLPNVNGDRSNRRAMQWLVWGGWRIRYCSSATIVLDTAGYGGEGIIFIAIGTSLATIILASSRSALAH